MAENPATNPASPKTSPEPIMDNQQVKELMQILRDNKSPSMDDFMNVLKQVTAMERQLSSAVGELAAMRKQLDEAKAVNHPAVAVMEKAVISAQNFIADLREKLAAIKQGIIEGCTNAVNAFKEKGIAALNNVVGFLGIKPALESMRNDLNKNIEADNRAIGKIEKISGNFHEAGKHLRNVGRALLGKEAVDEAKPVGKIAKAFTTPFKAERSCCESIKKHVEAAIGGLARLEQRAAEKKPSLMDALNAADKKVAQDKKDAPVVDAPKASKGER